MMVTTCGTLIFLALVCGPFLSGVSESFVGFQATAVALDSLDQGFPVILYGLHDEEMLFSLPMETEVHRTQEALNTSLLDDRTTVVCARERDFLRDLYQGGTGSFEVINRVEGLDLGRGRYATTVFFRLREDQ